MGQWTQGGMTMVGDMFNHRLKARVDAVCTELAFLLRSRSVFAAVPSPSADGSVDGSDGSVLPGLFEDTEVREERRNDMWWI